MKIKQKYLFIFFTVLFFEISFSQNKKTDSLLTLLKKDAEDSNKVNHLNELGFLNRQGLQIEQGLQFVNEAEKLSLQINFKKGIATANQYLSILLKNKGENENAILKGQKAISIYHEIGKFRSEAKCFQLVGKIYEQEGNYNEALKNYLTAFNIFSDIKNKTGQAESLNQTGNVQESLGNYTEALKNYFHSLKIAEEIGDRGVCADEHLNIGLIYENQLNFEEALKHFDLAKTLYKEIGEELGVARTECNLGVIYYQQKKITEAERSYSQAEIIFRKEEDYYGLAKAVGNLAMITELNGNPALAKKKFAEVLKIQDSIGDIEGSAVTNNNLGALLIRTKDLSEAKTVLTKALQTGIEIGRKETIQIAYDGFSKLYEAKGDFKLALENYKLAVTYQDSLNNEANTKKTIQTQMQYDFDKKSAADSIKNSEAKKFEEIKHLQEISKQKTFTYGGIAGFLVMIVVAGVSFRAFKNKQKANVEIQHQKELVEEKQKEILDSIYYARRIQRALITNEKYFSKNLNRLSKN